MADEQKVETGLEKETAPESKAEQPPKEEVKKEKTFSYTQQQLDDMVRTRLSKQKESLYKELGVEDLSVAKKALEEKNAIELEQKKKRGEYEDIIKQQAEKSNKEIQKLKAEMEQIKINDALLSSASRYKANVPDQVVALLKPNVKINEDGKVEVLEKTGQPRYNEKGELLSVSDYVEEFLTQNPHFQSATPSGSGSKGNVDRVYPKPFNIGDLNMANPEDRKKYADYKKDRDSKPTVINLTNN